MLLLLPVRVCVCRADARVDVRVDVMSNSRVNLFSEPVQ